MKKKFILIDTVSSRRARILVLGGNLGKIENELTSSKRRIFSVLKKLFKSVSNFDQIKGISVINGPGEFTNVRQGVVFANALAWALNVPLSATRIGQSLIFKKTKALKYIEPVYLRPPNITKSN